MKRKINRGKPLEELVKGSMDYTMQLIRDAFRNQFPSVEASYFINEIFGDHVIVSTFGIPDVLKIDEYWKIPYTKDGDTYIFAARDQWEVVELTYQPQTASQAAAQTEARKTKRKGRKFEERIGARVALQEREEGQPRRIRIEAAMTADVVNGNGRRYSGPVLEAAVAELRGHLNESAGQGRAIQVLGEAEHPSDKGGHPNLLETVTKWTDVTFNGQRVDVIGNILETSKGKDILTLMEGGVMPGVSLRGYGEGKNVKAADEKIFEVTELHITGFDLVLEPSFENSATLIESVNQKGDDEMTLEELLKLLKEHPEAFEGLNEAQIKKLGEAQLKALEEKVREALGIDDKANIAESLKTLTAKAQKFDESQKQAEVKTAIEEACKDLPFGEKLNKQFVEALTESAPKSAAEVKALAESKRKEYGKIAAELKLGKMGFNEGHISGVAPVLESENGTPEFANASFQLSESIRRANMSMPRNWKEPKSLNEMFTKRLLDRFDALYKHKLLAESREFNEAELTTDLNLPYSVSRALIEEAFPNLVASGIFDVGTIDTSPTRLYFETFSGETGYATTATDEVVTGGAEDTWYDLTYGRVTPGTVVVTSNPAGTTYVEGTDFVIDYAAGRIKFLTAGSINTNDVLVDYSYTAVRKGEMSVIERGKITLSYITIEAAADRLADQISREAIVFSRSQMGLDVVARTMSNLVRQLRRKIDQGLLYAAWSAVKSVASNSGGAWTEGTTQADYTELVRLIGATKLLVANRYYEPNAILCSLERSEDLSNWDGFKRDGFPNAVMNSAGYAGGVKGLPIFASTEFPSTEILVVNRQLVMHRVFSPLTIHGPYPTYDVSGGTSKLVAADQYYVEEFNVTESPVEEKGAYLTIAAGS